MKKIANYILNAWTNFVIDTLEFNYPATRIIKEFPLEKIPASSKKTPVGKFYHFKNNDYLSLKNVPDGLQDYYLIGRSWTENPDFPIAIAFGFNDWKLGAIADYCPEYRMIFVPSTKVLGWRLYFTLRKLNFKPNRIFIWGYTDRKGLVFAGKKTRRSRIEEYAQRNNIELTRVEDGFLRSAELGAKHSTAYSLVFDNQGLYYNFGEKSDLECLLEEYDFERNRELIDKSKTVLNTLIENGLTKYNLPAEYGSTVNFIKTRKTVLVIGQVDRDASVRMGNPDRWTFDGILKLAKLENPDAEILYRPHPEVYQGMKKSKFRGRNIKNIATIVPPTTPLTSIFPIVDRLYTISSTSGLEAIIRGIPVTTLGTPFYAGWGLTDDKVVAPKSRELTKIELFAICYLVYPKYLANPSCSLEGIQATIFSILGDRELLALSKKREQKSMSFLSRLLDSRDALVETDGLTVLKRTALMSGEYTSSLFLLSLGISGMDGMLAGRLLNEVAETADVNLLNNLLRIIRKARPEVDVNRAYALAVMGSKDYSLSQDLHIDLWKASKEDNERTESKLSVQDFGAVLSSIGDTHYDAAEFKEALNCYCLSLLYGCSALPLVEKVANIALQLAEYKSAYKLAKIYQEVDGGAATWTWKTIYISNPYVEEANLLLDSAVHVASKPASSVSNISKLADLGILEKAGFQLNAISKAINNRSVLSIGYIQSLIEFGQFELALDYSQQLARKSNTYQAAVLLSRALSFNDLHEEAMQVIEICSQNMKNELVYDQFLKMCIILGEYSKAHRKIKEAKELGIKISNTLKRKISFGNLDVYQAFMTFRDLRISQDLFKAYQNKHAGKSIYQFEGDSIILLPIFGPGDELRFASCYEKLFDYLPHKKIVVGTEPRFLSLFRRSMQHSGVEFIPVQRVLRSHKVDLKDYNKLPFSSLMPAMDNNAVEQAEFCSEVALVSDVLSEVLESIEDIPGQRFLKAEEIKIEGFRKRLPRSTLLCGINWRSSVTLQSRQEHYLTVEDLVPVFENTDITFVNLQYDECSDELEWLNERFPNRIINFEDIDQYNDFESVSALISCLDLVVAPCTTVAELAGSLGTKTLMLANSSELRWRTKNIDSHSMPLVDVWYNNVEHIRGESFGHKKSMVQNLVRRLNDLRTSCTLR